MIARTIRAAVYSATLAAICLPAAAQTPPPDAAPPIPPPATSVSPAPDQTSFSALPYASLPAQIADLLADPAVARDHWGILVTNLAGAPIFALNETQLFQPASNAKLYTTAAALAMLGPEDRFATRVIAQGKLSRGTLQGNLILRGGGDGDFDTGYSLPYVPPRERPKNVPEVA